MVFLLLILLFSNPKNLSDVTKASEISLTKVLSSALKYNRSLKEVKLNIKQLDATSKGLKAKFLPSFTSSVNVINSKADPVPGSFFSMTDMKKYEFQAGFNKLLQTGGVVGLNIKSDKQQQTMFISSMGDVNSKSYSSEIMLMISHPLLAGFGVKIAKSEIEKSRLNLEAERLKFEANAQGVIRDLIIAYLTLQNLWNQYDILLTGLKVSKSQLQLTKAMFDGDRATESDLLAVKTAVAQRRGDIVKIKSAILASSINLKKLMGISVAKPPWIYKPVINEKRFLNTKIPENFLKIVVKRSKELMILDKKLESLYHDEEVARNSLLPKLDATLSAGPTSASSTFSDSLKRLVKFKAFTISAGLSFSYSFASNAGIKSKVTALRISGKIIKLQKKNLKEQLISAAILAFDSYESASKRIKIANLTVKSAKAHLEKEKLLFSEGRGTNHSVLLRLQTLEQAKYSLLMAKSDAMIALTQIEALSGTILKSHHLKIQ